ncbi:hypothetical protein [Piscinibacter sp. XHJ-5]|uniref:hypothetical protein n=1 Tax=Piscinibacter sp. XHJ-5 TaxID=3037797 RepID=UPI0024528933|nr:hypothetical protein [Piscinibacter sp. XHJ-5]
MHAAAPFAHALSRRAPPPDAATLDIVVAAHKATRHFMFETLVRIGSLDVTDAHDVDGALNLLERLLDVLGEPRDGWRDAMHALRHGAASQRRGIAAQLYRDMVGLVGHQLVRLQLDEKRARVGSLSEPVGLRLQRLDDEELRGALTWMEGALTPQELAGLLDELHASTSAARFHSALAVLAERMDEDRWNRLALALGISQAAAEPAADALAA